MTHYVLKFIGGDMDGRILSSDSDDAVERTLVHGFLTQTANGRVDRFVPGVPLTFIEACFRGDSDPEVLNQNFGSHVYVISARTESDEVVELLIEYVLIDEFPLS